MRGPTRTRSSARGARWWCPGRSSTRARRANRGAAHARPRRPPPRSGGGRGDPRARASALRRPRRRTRQPRPVCQLIGTRDRSRLRAPRREHLRRRTVRRTGPRVARRRARLPRRRTPRRWLPSQGAGLRSPGRRRRRARRERRDGRPARTWNPQNYSRSASGDRSRAPRLRRFTPGRGGTRRRCPTARTARRQRPRRTTSGRPPRSRGRARS